MFFRKSWLMAGVAGFFAAGFLFLWYYHGTIAVVARETLVKFSRDLPEAISHEEFEAQNGKSRTLVNIVEEIPAPSSAKPSRVPAAAIPSTINLDIPFTSQAPFENWELPFKEGCEEASLLMVDRFYKGGRFIRESATDAILALVNFERSRLGSDQDTTAEQTALLAREYFGYAKVKVRYGPFTADDLKGELAAGHPLIVPMAGRLLGNPYFRRPGPYYHMLVIKGYTPKNFITNDPGTKRGAGYEYSYAAVLNAMHDFDAVSITTMPQSVIVVYPN
jgi:hypothetical protein